jgi:GntR family transcriptional regulator of vanillate catabolism
MSSAAESASQIERVVLTLREMLLRGEFEPGERLAELSLVQVLNASRTPVRLALERLGHEGLLEPLPGSGFRVREFTIRDIWDAIEVRGVLEGTAARFAAERLETPNELATLRARCDEARALFPVNVDLFVRYLEVNDAFHRELWRLAKSSVLVRALDAVCALPFAAPNALVFGKPGEMEASEAGIIAIEHHRAIVDAIANREGMRAESLAREHSRLARRSLSRALQDKAIFDRVPGASLVRLAGGGRTRNAAPREI